MPLRTLQLCLCLVHRRNLHARILTPWGEKQKKTKLLSPRFEPEPSGNILANGERRQYKMGGCDWLALQESLTSLALHKKHMKALLCLALVLLGSLAVLAQEPVLDAEGDAVFRADVNVEGTFSAESANFPNGFSSSGPSSFSDLTVDGSAHFNGGVHFNSAIVGDIDATGEGTFFDLSVSNIASLNAVESPVVRAADGEDLFVSGGDNSGGGDGGNLHLNGGAGVNAGAVLLGDNSEVFVGSAGSNIHMVGTLNVEGEIALGLSDAAFELNRPNSAAAGNPTHLNGQSSDTDVGGDLRLFAGAGPNGNGIVEVGTATTGRESDVYISAAGQTTNVLGDLVVDGNTNLASATTGDLTVDGTTSLNGDIYLAGSTINLGELADFVLTRNSAPNDGFSTTIRGQEGDAGDGGDLILEAGAGNGLGSSSGVVYVGGEHGEVRLGNAEVGSVIVEGHIEVNDLTVQGDLYLGEASGDFLATRPQARNPSGHAADAYHTFIEGQSAAPGYDGGSLVLDAGRGGSRSDENGDVVIGSRSGNVLISHSDAETVVVGSLSVYEATEICDTLHVTEDTSLEGQHLSLGSHSAPFVADRPPSANTGGYSTTFSGQDAGANGGRGGDFVVLGGDAVNGNGGNVQLVGGFGSGGSGGNIVLDGGESSEEGSWGTVFIATSSGNIVASHPDGDTIIQGDVSVAGKITLNQGIYGSLELDGTLIVTDDVHAGADLTVSGTSTLHSVQALGTADLSDLSVDGQSVFDGTVRVTGETIIESDFTVTGTTYLDEAHISNDVSLQSDLTVSNDVFVRDDLHVRNIADLNDVEVTGTLSVHANSFFAGVLSAEDVTTDDLSVGATFEVSGESDFASVARFDLDVTVRENLFVGNGLSVDGESFLNNTLRVADDAQFWGNVEIDHDLDVNEALHVLGTLTVDNSVEAGSLDVSGDTELNTLTAESATINNDLSVVQNAVVDGVVEAGSLSVAGYSSLGGDVLTFGDHSVAGDLTVDENLVAVADATFEADVGVEGDLAVTNEITSARLTVSGSADVQDLFVQADADIGGDAVVSGDVEALNAQFNNDLSVVGNANIDGVVNAGELSVHGFSSLGGDLYVFADQFISGDLTVDENLVASAEATFLADVDIEADLAVTDEITSARLTVSGSTDLGSLVVQGDADIDGDFEATNAQFNNDLSVVGNANVDGAVEAGSLSVNGFSSLGGDLYVFADQSISGDLTVDEHFHAQADATFAASITVATDADVTGQVSSATLVVTASADVGSLEVGGDANVGGDVDITGDLEASSGVFTATLQVNTDATIDGVVTSGVLTVAGYSSLGGDVFVFGTQNIAADLTVDENLVATGDATFEASITVAADADVTGQVSSATLVVTASADVGSLEVGGDANVGGDVDITGDLEASSGVFTATLQVNTDATIDGVVTSGVLTVAGYSSLGGDVFVFGTQNIAADLTVDENLHATGDATFEASVDIEADLAVTDEITSARLTVSGSTDLGSLVVQGDADIDGDFEATNAQFNNDLSVVGNANVDGAVDAGSLSVNGFSSLGGDLYVFADQSISGDLTVDEHFHAQADATFGADVDILGDLAVTDEITSARLTVSGSTDLGSLVVQGRTDTNLLDVAENAEVGGTLLVGSTATFEATATFEVDVTVTGDSFLDGQLSVNGETFLNDTLRVADNAEFWGELEVDLDLSVNDDIWVAGNSNVDGNAHSASLDTDGNAVIGGDLEAVNAEFSNDLSVTRNAIVDGIVNAGVLSVQGYASLGGDAFVFGDHSVAGDLTVDEDFVLEGAATFNSISDFHDSAHFHDVVDFDATATFAVEAIFMAGIDVTGVADVDTLEAGGALVHGELSVQGSSTLAVLYVDNDSSLGNDVYIHDDLSINDELTVNGLSTFDGRANFNAFVLMDAGSRHNGETLFDNDVTVNATATIDFVWADDILVNDELSVEGISFLNDLTVNGFGHFSTSIFVADDAVIDNDLTVHDDAGILGAVSIGGTLLVTNHAHFETDITVDVTATITELIATEATVEDDLTVQDLAYIQSLSVWGDSQLDGNAYVDGLLSVTAAATVVGPATFQGVSTFNDEVTVNGLSLFTVDAHFDADITVDVTATINELIATEATVEDDLTVQDLAYIQSLSVWGDSQLDGNAYVDGLLSVTAAATVVGPATFQGVSTFNDEVTVNGLSLFTVDAHFDADITVDVTATITELLATDGTVTNDFTVQQDTFLNTLTTSGSTSLGADLSVHGLITAENDVTIEQDLYVELTTYLNGPLTVDATSTFTEDATFNLDITVTDTAFVTLVHATDVSVTDDLTVDSVSFLTELTVSGTSLFEDVVTIDSILTVTGDSHLEQDVDIGGDLDVEGVTHLHDDLSVDGDVSLGGRLDIWHGPLSFRYPGVDSASGDVVFPLPDPYVVRFGAAGTFVPGTFFELELNGRSFMQLEPEIELPYISRFEVSGTDPLGAAYSYEVGDIILVKGSADLSKVIAIWDFEDLINILGPGEGGNIYNSRSFLSVSLNLFTEHLYSDQIFMYMYSPRPLTGLPTAVNVDAVGIQEAPVEWVKLN
ncbi:hypothetical protein QOT17_005424 [Balamuthia mandrillaris]